jgi:DNA end-binding protein Ku
MKPTSAGARRTDAADGSEPASRDNRGKPMSRAVWKGAIAFGLVYIPVGLYPGSKARELDFDYLDRRDFSPVGYQRINKRTGKVVEWADIVKGYEYGKGRYVVISDEDFRLANPAATQTIAITAVVPADAIDPLYFDTPYRLAPGKRGEKGYALLRDTLRRTGKIGIAQVVIKTRQHLAALLPQGNALTLQTLRYAHEILPADEFDLPAGGAAKATAKEQAMATRLVEDMAVKWDPRDYHDSYHDDLLARIQKKIKAGETHDIPEPGPAARETGGAQVIDLMAALQKSLERGAKRQPARKSARAAAIKQTSSRTAGRNAGRASAATTHRKRA